MSAFFKIHQIVFLRSVHFTACTLKKNYNQYWTLAKSFDFCNNVMCQFLNYYLCILYLNK